MHIRPSNAFDRAYGVGSARAERVFDDRPWKLAETGVAAMDAALNDLPVGDTRAIDAIEDAHVKLTEILDLIKTARDVERRAWEVSNA